MKEKMKSRYLTAIDELNVLTRTSYTDAEGNFSERVEQIIEDILSFLILAYKRGVEDCGEMLEYDDLLVDTDLMRTAIYEEIEGKTFEDRVREHVQSENLRELQMLAESEYHRIYNTGINDGAKQYVDNGNLGVNKTWVTIGDDKVRETHDYIEGVTIPVEEEFYTYDGDHAPFPGAFTNAANNVNCRCSIEISPAEKAD